MLRILCGFDGNSNKEGDIGGNGGIGWKCSSSRYPPQYSLTPWRPFGIIAERMELKCVNTNEVRCGVVSNGRPRPFRTIHQCLIVLGAKREDVYVGWDGHRKKYGSIYNRYERWELEYMAKELWKEAVKKYHPDQAPEEDREIYGHMTAEVNAAYNRILCILKYR